MLHVGNMYLRFPTNVAMFDRVSSFTWSIWVVVCQAAMVTKYPEVISPWALGVKTLDHFTLSSCIWKENKGFCVAPIDFSSFGIILG